jgi:probable HAF family extracellular repeat protein
MWVDDKITDLGTLGGAFSHAYGVNGKGVVVGSSAVADRDGAYAYVWDNGTMTELPNLAGSSGVATLINDRGDIAGNSRPSAFESQAVRWVDGHVEPLPTVGDGELSGVNGMNSDGVIVGWDDIDNLHEQKAVIWDGDSVQDLNSLIPADSGYVLTYAASINDAGQIVVTAGTQGQSAALLLTPEDGSGASVNRVLASLPGGARRDH